MTRSERIEGLKKAKTAAETVRDEIDRQNDADPLPSRQKEREPTRRRAIAEIRLTGRLIDDLEAASIGGDLDLSQENLSELDQLAARLDEAIQQNALVDLGLNTLAAVLDKAVRVKDILA